MDALCFICPHDALNDVAGGLAQLRYVIDAGIDEVVQHAERLDVVSCAVLPGFDVRVVSLKGKVHVSFSDERRPLAEAFVALSHVKLRARGEPHRGAVALNARDAQ